MLTKTIAILGEYDQQLIPLLRGLAEHNLQLLFVSHSNEKNVELIEQFDKFESDSELEIYGCEKDGCWEADIIIVYKPQETLINIIQKIKEVSTQKTVLVIQPSIEFNFKELLPHSRVIELGLDDLRFEDLKDLLIFGDPKFSFQN